MMITIARWITEALVVSIESYITQIGKRLLFRITVPYPHNLQHYYDYYEPQFLNDEMQEFEN